MLIFSSLLNLLASQEGLGVIGQQPQFLGSVSAALFIIAPEKRVYCFGKLFERFAGSGEFCQTARFMGASHRKRSGYTLESIPQPS